MRAVARDPRSAGLDPLELAIVEFAVRIAEDATSVTEQDIEQLRKLGLTDVEIFDVVAASCAHCFLSKMLDALGVRADPAYAVLEPELRDALVVGRPIARSSH